MSGNNPPPGSQHPQGSSPYGGQGGPGQGGPGQGGFGSQGGPGQGNAPGQGGFGQQSGPGYGPSGPQQGGQPGGPRGPQQGGYGQQPGGQQFGQQQYGQPGQPGQGNPYGPGGPGQPPGGPGGPGQPGKSSGGNKKLFIILGAVAAVLVLALVLGVTLLGKKSDPIANPGASTGASEPPKASTAPAAKPSDAVKGFLEALAAGDPEAALGFASKQPAETSLLTAEVLQASVEEAPITEINVPEVTDQYAYQVPATYKMGSKNVSEQFTVSKQADDTYLLGNAVIDFDVSNLKNADVPMSINGVDISDDATNLSLFPGSYTFSTGTDNLAYGEETLLVKSPSDYVSTSDLQLKITAEGKKAFLSASKEALQKCLKQKKLKPSGCPNQINPPKDGSKVKKGSMKWSVKGNPFSGLDPRLDYDDPTQATGSASLNFKYEASLTKGGQSGKSSGSTYKYVKFVVDLTKDDPTATFE